MRHCVKLIKQKLYGSKPLRLWRIGITFPVFVPLSSVIAPYLIILPCVFFLSMLKECPSDGVKGRPFKHPIVSMSRSVDILKSVNQEAKQSLSTRQIMKNSAGSGSFYCHTYWNVFYYFCGNTSHGKDSTFLYWIKFAVSSRSRQKYLDS